MLHFVLLLIFATASEAADVSAKRMITLCERQTAAGAQLHLSMTQERTCDAHTDQVSFDAVSPLLKTFLYPDIGYGELFPLLSIAGDPVTPYMLQKFAISILVNRINRECIDSNAELCSYLLCRYNTCCSYDSTLIAQLREWRAEIESRKGKTMVPVARQARSTNVLPNLSRQGRCFLQSRSGIRDHQLSDREFLKEYLELPEAFKRAVHEEAAEGGRFGFDTYCDATYGVSLPVLQSDKSTETADSNWFSSCMQILGGWISKSSGQRDDKQALLFKKK